MAKSTAALTGYCMSTKEKNVPMLNITIDKNGPRYLAKGEDKDGHKMSVAIGLVKAEELIKTNEAKRGKGWDEESTPAKTKKGK